MEGDRKRSVWAVEYPDGRWQELSRGGDVGARAGGGGGVQVTGLYAVYWKWRFGPAPKWEVYDRPSGFITADPVAQYFSEEEMDFRLAAEGLVRGRVLPGAGPVVTELEELKP